MSDRILLINPPVWFEGDVPRTLDTENPPLGLLYLASYLRAHSDLSPRVLDVAPQGLGIGRLTEILRHERPLAVGIASMTLQLQGAVEVATLVRRVLPGVPIFLGGNHVSGDPGFVERNAALFDHGITGEAERTLLHSLLQLQRGERPPRLQRGEFIERLDDLPFPDRALVDRRRYLRPEYLMASRGCPFRCAFCSTPALAGGLRRRSVGNVLSEMESLLSLSRGRLAFQDDNFTAGRDFALELCGAIATRGWNLRWTCSTRVDLIDEELIHRMKRAGCEAIHFGIESGSERLRAEAMGKGGFDNARVRETIRVCRRSGLRANGFFILGTPTESEAELKETRDFILGSGLSAVAISLPLPFPGSSLFLRAQSAGVVDESFIDRFARKELGAGVTGVYPLYLEGLDRETLTRAMREIYRSFYLRPRIGLDMLLRDLSSPAMLRQDLRSALHLIRKGTSCRKPFA